MPSAIDSGMNGIGCLKKALGAPEARKRWCKCVDEFSVMLSYEAKTNPRYAIATLDRSPVPQSPSVHQLELDLLYEDSEHQK